MTSKTRPRAFGITGKQETETKVCNGLTQTGQNKTRKTLFGLVSGGSFLTK